MQNKSTYFTISISIVTLIIWIWIWYFFTPEYKLSMYNKNEMNLWVADRWIDLRYLNAMIAHHRWAMLLADQAKENAQKSEIKNLAWDILKGEPKLIDELYWWKRDWYNDIRTVRDPYPTKLWWSDEKFELRFLNALIAHHENWIEMTKEIRTKSSKKEVLDNADAVEQFLTTTLEMLKKWRSEWYWVN